MRTTIKLFDFANRGQFSWFRTELKIKLKKKDRRRKKKVFMGENWNLTIIFQLYS